MGGISGAICLTLMLLSAVLPFSTYALPALAGIALIPAALEMGLSTASVAYAAVGLLSLALVPDPETSLMFAAFFGYYPILRLGLERLRYKILRIAVKLAVFNLSMLLAYRLLIGLLGMSHLAEDFSGGFGWLLLGLGNIGLWLYDLALENVTRFYHLRLRRILFGKNGR